MAGVGENLTSAPADVLVEVELHLTKKADGGRGMEKPVSAGILPRGLGILPGMPGFWRKAEGRVKNAENEREIG